jgi:hypothetical protein
MAPSFPSFGQSVGAYQQTSSFTPRADIRNRDFVGPRFENTYGETNATWGMGVGMQAANPSREDSFPAQQLAPSTWAPQHLAGSMWDGLGTKHYGSDTNVGRIETELEEFSLGSGYPQK